MKKFAVIFLISLVCSCTTSRIFKDIGENIASPSAITIDAAGKYLYVVNSNSNVLYEWDQGSIQSYQLALNSSGVPVPVALASSLPTKSLGGEMYVDAPRSLIYVTNRYSESREVTEDHLNTYQFSAAASLSDFSTTSTALDPFGMYCCYPANRLWYATASGVLQYVDLGGTLSPGSVSLKVLMDDGRTIQEARTNFITVQGNQAFLSNIDGGLFVINLDEVGVAGKQPVDYVVSGISQSRGLAADATNLYVLSEGPVNDEWLPHVAIIALSSLPALVDNTTAVYLDSDETNAIVAKRIEVPSDPQKISLTQGLAPNMGFVTCRSSDKIAVINLGSQEKVLEIESGREPYSMAFYTVAGVEQFLYVGNLYDDDFSIIKVSTDPNQISIVATYP